MFIISELSWSFVTTMLWLLSDSWTLIIADSSASLFDVRHCCWERDVTVRVTCTSYDVSIYKKCEQHTCSRHVDSSAINNQELKHRKNLEQNVMFQLGTLYDPLCTGLTNASHSANLLTNSCHHISTDGKAPWHSLINRQHPTIRQWFLDEIELHFEKAWFSHSWVTCIWLLNLACPKTAKKICAASSNATSSSRVWKSEGDFSQCKNLFGKQIVRCSLLRKRFTAVPIRKVNYFNYILLFSPCVGPIH